MPRLGQILPVLLLLCSCATNSPVPDNHYYKLPWQQGKLPAVSLSRGTIFVEQFITDGLYRERPLLHTEDQAGIDLRQYHYHYWVDAPARLLRDQLLLYLSASHAAARLSAYPDATAELGIHGTVRGFEIRNHGNTRRVFVDLAFRVDRQGMESPLLLSDYQAQEDIQGPEMVDAVAAFEAALSRIFASLVSDLREKLIN